MNAEEQYLKLLKDIREKGIMKENRTGINAYKLPYHSMIQHDMSEGFPLITTKKMGLKSISAELEFFIKGLTDKQWLTDRKCRIWGEWSNPDKIPNGLSDDERKEFQLHENDLGKIYGYQWRNFNSQDYDQLKNVVDTLKTNPDDRRMIVSAWNPIQLKEMALPPCHMIWGVDVVDNKLNLWWTQRSVDCFLGLPFNIASYAILLKLLALESGFEEGILTGFLCDIHIYENHTEQVDEQLSRTPYKSPTLEIKGFKNIYEWEYDSVSLVDYKHHPVIKAKVAV